MAIKSSRWKQPSFHPLTLNNQTIFRDNHLSHGSSSGPPTKSVRTRTMSRKSVGGLNSSDNVVLLKVSLFVLVFVSSNFHASFGRKHDPSNHHYRHSNHHQIHHSHHHVQHNHKEGGIRTCSHRPPKPEEVRELVLYTFTCSHKG